MNAAIVIFIGAGIVVLFYLGLAVALWITWKDR
jgi:hypothetical protein